MNRNNTVVASIAMLILCAGITAVAQSSHPDAPPVEVTGADVPKATEEHRQRKQAIIQSVRDARSEELRKITNQFVSTFHARIDQPNADVQSGIAPDLTTLARSADPLMLATLSTSDMAANNANTMTPEETIVRNSYAKITYAVELGTLHELAHKYYRKSNAPEIDRSIFAAHMADDELRFQLSEVRVGNLSDIAQVKYDELVTKPSGVPALSVHGGVLSYTEEGRKVPDTETATASWVTSQTLLEDWNLPFKKVQAMVEQDREHTYGMKLARRYLSCTVTVFYQGRSSSYKALWLFGANGEVVSAMDTMDLNGCACRNCNARDSCGARMAHWTRRRILLC